MQMKTKQGALAGLVLAFFTASLSANTLTATIDALQVNVADKQGYVRLTALPTIDGGGGCTNDSDCRRLRMSGRLSEDFLGAGECDLTMHSRILGRN